MITSSVQRLLQIISAMLVQRNNSLCSSTVLGILAKSIWTITLRTLPVSFHNRKSFEVSSGNFSWSLVMTRNGSLSLLADATTTVNCCVSAASQKNAFKHFVQGLSRARCRVKFEQNSRAHWAVKSNLKCSCLNSSTNPSQSPFKLILILSPHIWQSLLNGTKNISQKKPLLCPLLHHFKLIWIIIPDKSQIWHVGIHAYMVQSSESSCPASGKSHCEKKSFSS